MQANSTDLVTYSGVNLPRRSLNFRQGSTVVDNPSQAGSSAWFLVNERSEVLEFSISKCNNKRCKTCPKLETKPFFYSNVIRKKDFIVSPSFKNINCHTSNIIYLLTCEDRGTQYVGETANELHILINLHRRGKSGCPHINEHFNSCCKGKSYSIQIIEVFSGNGHNEMLLWMKIIVH